MNLEEFYDKVENYFKAKSDYENEIINVKRNINEKKEQIYYLIKKKNDIEQLMNKFKYIQISEKSSFEEIFHSECMKDFFGEEECNKFIDIFNKVNFFDEVYKNQNIFYIQLQSIFDNFLKEINKPKKLFEKYISYHHLYMKYDEKKKKRKI